MRRDTYDVVPEFTKFLLELENNVKFWTTIFQGFTRHEQALNWISGKRGENSIVSIGDLVVETDP